MGGDTDSVVTTYEEFLSVHKSQLLQWSVPETLHFKLFEVSSCILDLKQASHSYFVRNPAFLFRVIGA